MQLIRQSLFVAIAIALLASISLRITASPTTQPASRPSSIVLNWPDGQSATYTLSEPIPPPVTLPTATTRPTTRTADPNLIRVSIGDDLGAALLRMADGRTLQLQAGGRWPVVIGWRWSNATLASFGEGPPPQIRGIAGVAPFTDTEFRGIALAGQGGYGVDLRKHRVQRVRFVDVSATGFGTCYSIHLDDLENVPADRWHRDVSFVNCRAIGARSDDEKDLFKGQGWYVANVDGLTFDGCHADDCGGLVNPNIFRHGWYIAAFNRRVVTTDNAATRCSSYGLQVRAAGAVIERNAVYGCGMGILANGDRADVRQNVVVRGHAHGPSWTYGKGGFDLHLGGGDIVGNLVVNGPQVMPARWYRPPAFNVGYRETKRDKDGRVTNQPWEWIRGDPPRPLAKLGAGNLDRSDVIVPIDVDRLLAGRPADVAAAIASAARSAAK